MWKFAEGSFHRLVDYILLDVALDLARKGDAGGVRGVLLLAVFEISDEVGVDRCAGVVVRDGTRWLHPTVKATLLDGLSPLLTMFFEYRLHSIPQLLQQLMFLIHPLLLLVPTAVSFPAPPKDTIDGSLTNFRTLNQVDPQCCDSTLK